MADESTMEFDGKTVWITGGGTGIGKAIAAAFVHEGARVVLSGRGAKRIDEAAAELGNGVRAIPCDVSDANEVAAVTGRISELCGPIDILVNNAGVTVFKPFLSTSIEEFDELTAVNLRGPFLTTKAVLPSMIERGGGTVVMINSMAARQVFPNSSVYAATKGGLKWLADCLRLEVRASGIRIINVHPGATNTPIWPDPVRSKHAERMMHPEDVAEAILSACKAPKSVMIEEIVLQPIGGAL
ncbi:MAG: SDR family oxidoreductase [Bacteroidetes bacterium]|nr:SDR family oxidoreductase [Bacteroidota bacterium]